MLSASAGVGRRRALRFSVNALTNCSDKTVGNGICKLARQFFCGPHTGREPRDRDGRDR